MNITPEQLRDLQAGIRKVLTHHGLTKAGDGVIEGDLIAEFQKLQAEQEPVAWHYLQQGFWHYTDEKRDWYDGVNVEEVVPLYAAPPDLAAKVAKLEAETGALRSLANNAITTLEAGK